MPDRPGHDGDMPSMRRRFAVNSDRTPEYDFDSGIAKTIEWYLANGEWCRKVLDGKYSRERLGLKEDTKP